MEKRVHIASEDKDANMGQQLISKYIPYWPLFILFALVSLVLAYVYLRYVTPLYQASATIIIKDDTRGGGEDKFAQSLNLIEAKKSIENEIQVLKSRELMEKVVKALYLYAPITQEGKIKSGDAYTLSPIVIEAKDPTSIQEVEKVKFDYDKNNQTVTLNNADKYPVNQFVNTAYGVLKFTPNKYNFSYAAKAKNQLYFSLEDVRVVASSLLDGLKIVPNIKTQYHKGLLILSTSLLLFMMRFQLM
jgi:tyrosine-protein kinase Etk/Wzc